MITKEDEDALQKEYWKDVPLLKYQLYSALEAFTDGEAKKEVRFNDEANVFTTWSRLSDKGHSRRTRNVADMQRKAYATRSVVAAKDLESAILEYEKDVMQFEEASGKRIDPDQRLIILTDMLPPALCQRIKDFADKFKTYDDTRAEALNWLADHLRPKGKLAMITDVAMNVEIEIPYDQIDEFMEDPAKFGVPSDAPPERLYTLVKNSRLKRAKGDKGCGKGGGKAKGARKCFECDAEGHIASECPIRLTRVAAGGPERLDDPMGTGKAKGKGKKEKAEKGVGKGGKGGVWTSAGDH